MCAAIDMLGSEQMFYGRSPPAGFLTSYTPQVRRPTKLTSRGVSAPCLTTLKPVQLTLRQASRSCLRMEAEKKKKRVVFADERGLDLQQVKYMTEPSYMPPYWALEIVPAAPPAPILRPQPVGDVWELRFNQPASDYLEFRRRITEECVSLENVIIKQNECALDGTVKVKNIDFEKEIFIRASADGWNTYEDTSCAFLETGPLGSNGQSLYDTFAFRLQLPIHSRKLEFCVCFKSKGQEFWDNNRGINYIVEKASVRNSPGIACARIKYGNAWSPKSALTGNTPYW